ALGRVSRLGADAPDPARPLTCRFIPSSRRAAYHPPHGDAVRVTAKAAAAAGRKRLAVVEDDADIADALAYNLEKTGSYQVERFASGEAALAAIETGRFDLAIVDLSLPDLDGLTLCRELRSFEATSRLPILFLTARVTERDRVRGFDA